MTRAVPWLPAEVLRSTHAAKPFAKILGAWTESWFVKEAWSPVAAFHPLAAPGDWSLLRQKEAFQISAKPKVLLELAFAILGERPKHELADADVRFLRRLGGRALDDLTARLDALLFAVTDIPKVHDVEQWQLTIGAASKPWLAIVIDESVLATVARNAFPRTRALSPLTSICEAIETIEVPLASWIGSARIAIEQIDALEVGDLLLLDERVETPARLLVAGNLSDLLFKIGDAHDRLTLTMQERNAQD